MVEINPIPRSIIAEAQKRSIDLGSLKNSITKGDGNIVGYIGQMLFAAHLKGNEPDHYEYDVEKNGVTYEVKSKKCTTLPQPYYECSVSEANPDQKCDYYVFVRVKEDLTKAWILGKKKRSDFFKQARFCKKGEIDEKSHLGWIFKATCYNLAISDLEPI